MAGARHEIQGNYIGTNADGSVGLGRGCNAIDLSDASYAKIGGTTPGAGNLISSNGTGIFVGGHFGTVGNEIQGNLIGLDATGSFAIPNTAYGMYESGFGTLIGGDDDDDGVLDGIVRARNGISGNGVEGIRTHGGSRIHILGNYIGTNAASTRAAPNFIGISANGVDVVIGGAAAGAGNLISGNTYGIHKGHGFGDGGARTIQRHPVPRPGR